MIRDKVSCHGMGRRSTSVDDCGGRFDDARDIGGLLPSAPLERGDGVIGERHALASRSSHSKSSYHLDCSVVGVKTTTSFGADRSMSGDGVSGLRQHRGEVLDDDVRHGYLDEGGQLDSSNDHQREDSPRLDCPRFLQHPGCRTGRGMRSQAWQHSRS